MPLKRLSPDVRLGEGLRELAEKLAAELKNSREYGQPVIYEHTYPTGKVHVNVIWDEWEGVTLQERTATILRAYELAQGPETRQRIALASGLTMAEASGAGMLPYVIIPALRPGDAVTLDEARQVMLEEGASRLGNGLPPHLLFATEEEAEAGRKRLVQRLPKSEPIWIISREIAAQDHVNVNDF